MILMFWWMPFVWRDGDESLQYWISTQCTVHAATNIPTLLLCVLLDNEMDTILELIYSASLMPAESCFTAAAVRTITEVALVAWSYRRTRKRPLVAIGRCDIPERLIAIRTGDILTASRAWEKSVRTIGRRNAESGAQSLAEKCNRSKAGDQSCHVFIPIFYNALNIVLISATIKTHNKQGAEFAFPTHFQHVYPIGLSLLTFYSYLSTKKSKITN